MKTSGRRATTAVAIAVLAIAGCSNSPSESPGDVSVASSASGTSDTAPASTAPAVSRPLTDFVENAYYHSFATQGGQIQCRVGDDSLVCQFEGDGDSLTVADNALCGFYPGVEQGHTRRFGFFGDRPQPCATIIQGEGFDSPHTLDYGQSVTAELSPGHTVTCASAVNGLTCTSVDGFERGFLLTVDSFTVI